MAARFLLAVLTCLLFTADAEAGGKPYVRWTGTFDEAVEEATERNLPIVVFFLRDEDEDCEKWQATIIRNEVLVKHVAEFALAVIAAKEKHHEREELDKKTGEKRLMCSLYKTIRCDDHVAAYRQAKKKLKYEEEPMGFICDSAGTEIYKMNSTVAGEYNAGINDALKKSGGDPITGSKLKKLEKNLTKGDGKLRKGKFKDALKAYTKTAEDEDVPEFVRNRAQARLEKLKEAALAAVETAKGLKPSKAKGALKKLKKEVAGIEEANAAVDAALEELGG